MAAFFSEENPIRKVASGLFKTKETLGESDYRKSVSMLTLDGVCSMGMGALQGGVFLCAFALALGATNYEIGLIATIGFFAQFMQLPGLLLVKHFRKRRAIVVASAGLSRIMWLFIILTPFIFKDKGISFLLQWLTISMLAGGIAGPAWNSLLRDVVPAKSMGNIFARRMMLGTILALSLNLSAGYFVDWWKKSFSEHSLYAYSILFTIALIFGIIGLFSISKIPEPQMDTSLNEPILKEMGKPLKDGNFRNLLMYVGTWTFAVNLSGPFFIIYMLKRIGLSLFMVTLLTVTSQISNILFIRIWGKLADRFSNKSVLSVSGPLFMIVILAWTFTTMPERYFLTIPLLFIIHFFSGVSTAGVSISSANIALKLSPKGTAHIYLTIFGLVGALTGSIAPMLGGMFADFFSVRELSLAFNWSEPARQLSVYALNLKALDFLFLISFVVGLYSIRRLASVKEEGEVEERELLDQLKDEVALPLRSIASIEGMRRMTLMPFTTITNISKKLSGKIKHC
ncbi:MAG: MFS transporter [Syntrophaceae bacterium]|nr:MFS transporter [Syntrophaceae bacterium]